MFKTAHKDINLVWYKDIIVEEYLTVDRQEVAFQGVINEGVLQLSFEVNDSQDILDLGHKTALKIFSRYAYFLSSVMSCRKDIVTIEFSSDAAQGSRYKLYKRMAMSLAKMYDGQVTMDSHYFSHTFYIALG